MKQTFNDWHIVLCALARKHRMGFLVKCDKEAWRSNYEDGDTPKQALESELDSWRQEHAATSVL